MLHLNLFHEQQAIQREKDYDPVRLTIMAGIVGIAVILFWAAILYVKMGPLREELDNSRISKSKLDKEFKDLGPATNFPKIQSQALSLQKRILHRTLFANQLGLIRDLTPTNCQVRTFKSARSFKTIEEKSKDRKGRDVITKKITPTLDVTFEINTRGSDKVEILQVRDNLLDVLHKNPALTKIVQQEPSEENPKKMWNAISVESSTQEPKGNEKAIGIFKFIMPIALKDEPHTVNQP